MPSWLPPWTPPSPPQFRSPPFVDRNSHPGFHPSNVRPPAALCLSFSPSRLAYSVPCYYQPPSTSRSGGTTSVRCRGALGRKGKFLVRVQTHWRLLSCCRHVLRGAEEGRAGKGEAAEENVVGESGRVRPGNRGNGMDRRRGSEGCKQPWPDKQTDGPETPS